MIVKQHKMKLHPIQTTEKKKKYKLQNILTVFVTFWI